MAFLYKLLYAVEPQSLNLLCPLFLICFVLTQARNCCSGPRQPRTRPHYDVTNDFDPVSTSKTLRKAGKAQLSATYSAASASQVGDSDVVFRLAGRRQPSIGLQLLDPLACRRRCERSATCLGKITLGKQLERSPLFSTR